MYEAKLEFLGERGVQNEKPSVGGVWIFSGTCTMLYTTTYNYWYNLGNI